jgi:serralysin
MTGGVGDDSLDGGTGVDTMVGGTGNDTYFVDDTNDVVTENAGEGTTDTVWTTVKYTLGVNSQVESLKVNTTTGRRSPATRSRTPSSATLARYADRGIGMTLPNGGVGADTMTGGAATTPTSSTTPPTW